MVVPSATAMRRRVAIDGLAMSRSTCDRKLSVTPGLLGDRLQGQATTESSGAQAAADQDLFGGHGPDSKAHGRLLTPAALGT